MDYVTVDLISSWAIPILFTPGITTSTHCVLMFSGVNVRLNGFSIATRKSVLLRMPALS